MAADTLFDDVHTYQKGSFFLSSMKVDKIFPARSS